MNLKRRERIAGLVVKMFVVRLSVSGFVLQFWTKLLELRAEFINRKTRKIQETTKSLNRVTQRLLSLAKELKTLDNERAPRKQELLATKAALLEEAEQLQLDASRMMKTGASWATPVLKYAETSLDESCFSIQKNSESLCRILVRIDSATFYWDLLLWFLIPGVHSEEMLGDLNEEYLLRVSDDGDANANAWYQHQALATIMRYLWKRIERIATVATLIDLIERWFKK